MLELKLKPHLLSANCRHTAGLSKEKVKKKAIGGPHVPSRSGPDTRRSLPLEKRAYGRDATVVTFTNLI